MDRRGAAPARQQRRVHVDHAEPGQVEQRRRQDPAVGRDDGEIRCERAQLRRGTPRPSAARAGGRADRARTAAALTGAAASTLLSAAAGPVRLRDDADDRDGGDRAARRVTARRMPACRRRRRAAASPLAGALQLPDLADDQVALDAAQPIEEQHAVEVIDLVLEGASQQACAFDRCGLPRRDRARARRPARAAPRSR